MAFRQGRLLLSAGPSPAHPALSLRHLPSTFQHPDLLAELLVEASRAPGAVVSPPGGVLRLSPDCPYVPCVAPDHPGSHRPAGTPLPTGARGATTAGAGPGAAGPG